jgi:hypothetical protein
MKRDPEGSGPGPVHWTKTCERSASRRFVHCCPDGGKSCFYLSAQVQMRRNVELFPWLALSARGATSDGSRAARAPSREPGDANAKRLELRGQPGRASRQNCVSMRNAQLARSQAFFALRDGVKRAGKMPSAVWRNMAHSLGRG